MSPDRPSLVRVRHQRSALFSRCKGKPPMTMVSPHKGTIMWKMREITNVLLFAFKIVLLFCLIGSVNDLDTTACPSVSFLGAIAMEFGMDIIVTYGNFLHHIYSGDNWCGGWQLMWPFRFVTVPACGLFGLWPFRSVAVSVYGHSGLWPFRFVAVSVCGRLGLWPFRFVAVMTCYLFCY